MQRPKIFRRRSIKSEFWQWDAKCELKRIYKILQEAKAWFQAHREDPSRLFYMTWEMRQTQAALTDQKLALIVLYLRALSRPGAEKSRSKIEWVIWKWQYDEAQIKRSDNTYKEYDGDVIHPGGRAIPAFDFLPL